MSNPHENICRIESAIRDLRTGGSDIPEARRIIRDALQDLAQIAPDSSLSLADTFELIAKDGAVTARRDIGSLSIRLVSEAGVLPAKGLEKCRRHIVGLIEKGCPDLIPTEWPDQNHEKIESVKSIHHGVCERLSQLRQPFSSLEDISSRRQPLMQELNHGLTKGYLNSFGFRSVSDSVASLLNLVHGVVNSQGYEWQARMQSLVDRIAEDAGQYKGVPTFVVQEYMLPFLQQLQSVARLLQDTMAERFACTIDVPKSPYELERKYPLHVPGSQIHIFVPLTNRGPGVAQNVRAYCVADYCDVQSEETSLGDVEPGSFFLPLVINVTESQEHIDLEVEIRWDVVGDSPDHTRSFSVRAQCQRTDLDWKKLSLDQPYSLEVASEKEFFGRKDALQRIVRLLASGSMQSCYITGQKRVGKSSLALAVGAHIESNTPSGDYRVLYLECGEIMHSSGKDTLNELGTRLEEFFAENLHEPPYWQPKGYSSSLTPLNRLLNQIKGRNPDSRFVVILDEFDEINESLYRSGELADTFFLNLRTLSSRRNIAFVLVGAERMPYVMSSQGEKLNRFKRESLDSFNWDTEWADYRDLVQTPVEGAIKFHESALRKLFELTNGHPYFTKMLCQNIYEYAVDTKDAEVWTAEVERAAQRVVATLDINSFVHYWRDGIRGDSNETEIVSLKRCRLLVAWARTARSGKQPDHDSIRSNVHSGALPSGEVLPLLEDFCRRGVFRDQEGVYYPAVSLFAAWLKEGGFPKLVSDLLGDELAEAKQRREDAAFVQSGEILDVARQWDLYQGHEVTTDIIRVWLGQVDSHVHQRLLFKVLQNVRFFRNPEVGEKFVHAHRLIRAKLPIFVKKSRAQRRDDIVVSYADGHGKSGLHYAEIYARANEIVSKNVETPSKLGAALGRIREQGQVGLVIVDDMIGTGHNLVDRLSGLSDVFEQAKVGTDIPLSVVVLCGTVEGEQRVRAYLADSMPNADLEICEMLESRHFAFGDSVGFWETEDEKMEAKALVMDLGARVQKNKPLGFENQGLLLTFSRNCPNNSLPILHGSAKGERSWNPLFPRAKT